MDPDEGIITLLINDEKTLDDIITKATIATNSVIAILFICKVELPHLDLHEHSI
jgi:hypothetical protein